jgi:hypothetical protein
MFDYTRCNNTQLISFFFVSFILLQTTLWQNRGKGVICLIKRRSGFENAEQNKEILKQHVRDNPKEDRMDEKIKGRSEKLDSHRAIKLSFMNSARLLLFFPYIHSHKFLQKSDQHSIEFK